MKIFRAFAALVTPIILVSSALAQAPTLTSFTPTSGPAGVIVTLTGTNLSSATSITFGGVAAPTQTFNGGTSLKVVVPTGAVTGPIVFTNSSGTATSSTSFTVAPTGTVPANDNFSAAYFIGGGAGTISGSSVYATKESGEPAHAGTAGGHSVWFRWTAPSSGYYLFDQRNSEFGAFLGVYTGSSVGALTTVATGNPSNNYFMFNYAPAVLNAQAGVEYFIALDGYAGTSGAYSLAWSALTSGPTVTGFTPTTSGAGLYVSVSGTGFVPGMTVTVGGVAQTWVTVNSPTSLAINGLSYGSVTGPVVVTTPVGSATGPGNLTVLGASAPTISSFTPSFGAAGTGITISGNALYLGGMLPIVRINGVQGSLYGYGYSMINVTVPSGATSGPISVQTEMGTVTSSTSFTVGVPVPPTIVLQPAGATLNASNVASFGVTVTGTDPFTYQWRKNGVALTGAVSNVLMLGQVTPASAGSYDVVVSNAFGTVTSSPAVLTINPPITIVTQPAAVAGFVGMPLTLSVAVESTVGGLNYQWRKDGGAIPGATGSTFALAALQSANAGSYDVVLSSVLGYTVTSNPAAVAVSDAAPSFAVQPGSSTVAVGGAVTLSVNVNGSWPLTYQWRRNGLTLTGATGASLPIANAQTYDNGDYAVTVSNSLGSVTSTVGRINVVPRVVTYSARLVVGPEGALGVFTVEGMASKMLLLRAVGPGLAPFGITGLLADPQLEVFGPTGNLLAVNDNWGTASNLDAVGATTAAVGAFALSVGSRDSVVLRAFAPGTYTVRASAANGVGGVCYLELYDADLAAGPISTIPYVAVRGRVAPGSGVVIGGMGSNGRGQRSYLLRAVGPGLGLPAAVSNPSFLVVRDNTLVGMNDTWDALPTEAAATTAATTRLGLVSLAAGGPDAALVLTGNIHAGPHTVQVSSPEGPGGLVLVELHDLDAARPAMIAPAIASGPAGLSVTAGGLFTLRALAYGTGPLSYQWIKDGVPVSGANAATYTVVAATSAHAGSYTLVVTNPQGTVTSLPAMVTLQNGSTGNTATQAVVGSGYAAGGTVVISNTLSYIGTPSSLGWSVALPPGWSFSSDAGTSGDVKPAVGTTGTLEWAWSTVPASPVTFTYTVNVPVGEGGPKSLVASAIVRESGNVQVIAPAPSPLTVLPPGNYHSADTTVDGRISLIELTRVIELYNTRNGTTRTGCYLLQPGTEDGYAADSVRASATAVSFAAYHAADSNRDGKLSLVELTRVIELYNYRNGTTRTGQYHVQSGTEDGFGPGP